MNLVAHQYLSFNDPSLQIGNLLGEIVKGNNYTNYPTQISRGILLHRMIDSFTDNNDIVKKSTSYFHATQNKYAPIVVDLLYDYYLIKNWNQYHDTPFNLFKDQCYQLFITNYDNFPTPLQTTINHLIQYDWFSNYTTLDGIQKTLTGIGKRTTFSNNLDYSLDSIIKHYEIIENHFHQFFPKIIKMSQEYIDKT